MPRIDSDQIDILLEAGRYLDAAEALEERGEIEDAGLCCLCELPARPTALSDLGTRQLAAARKAALCFERSGHVQRSAVLWLALGERERAAGLLDLADRTEDAQAVRHGGGVRGSDWPEGHVASRFDLEVTAPQDGREGPEGIDRARDLEHAGQLAEALAVLLSVPDTSPSYDECVGMATRLAWDHELATSIDFDLFVEPFLCSAPRAGDPSRAGPLYGLGRLYERLDVRRAARRAFRGTLDLAPGFLDAEQRLEALALAEEEAVRWGRKQRSGEVGSLISTSGARLMGSTPSGSISTSTGPGDLTPSDRARDVAAAVGRRSMVLGLGTVGPGTVVANRFVLDRPIGEGGYSVVFEALDVQETRPVAVKLFRQNRRDPGGLARFQTEMQITRRLNHPNIVRTYEVGAWRSLHYIAMELLQGNDLGIWLDALGGRAPLPETFALLGQALTGVGAAHQRGVVHRDIKPTNLFVTDGGVLKVMDFGLATAADLDSSNTSTGKVVGTPAYIAPERLRKSLGRVGPASDVYSLGVVLYQMISGVPPFPTTSVAELFRHVLDDHPAPPSEHRPSVPPAVDRLVLRMLERRPESRFADCAEVLAAIDRLAGLA